MYIKNSSLEDLWDYSSFWSLIIAERPEFNMTLRVTNHFGLAIPDAQVNVANQTNQVPKTDSEGRIVLKLPIGLYQVTLKYRSQSIQTTVAPVAYS